MTGEPPQAGEDRSIGKQLAQPHADDPALEPGPADANPQGMVPARETRGTGIERGAMRVLATGGIVGIATAVGAVLVSQDVAGWIVGAAVSLISLALAALLWSSRQL